MKSYIYFLGLLLLLSKPSPTLSDETASTCSDTDGSCSASATEDTLPPPPPPPPPPKATKQKAATKQPKTLASCGSSSLYGNGGGAQAYRAEAPLSSVVCRPEVSQNLKQKVSSWPFTRRSFRKGTAPTLDVTLNMWSCTISEIKVNEDDNNCSCERLGGAAARNASSIVEIWQTRPDGRYSSLNSLKKDSNDCRAQVPLSDQGTAQFSTVAPGSTGIMNGLGPGGWEWSPYGPPVIHLLVRVAGHGPLLLDLPALIHPKTLEPRKFSIGDFRGSAWARQKRSQESLPMTISSWQPNVEENRISMTVAIYVQQSSDDAVPFCQSRMYGLPGSFYVEPIAVCAPSLLDFFAL